MVSRVWLAVLLTGALAGCANFAAVKEFGEQTERLTTLTGAELQFAAQNCDKVAQARRVVEGARIRSANCEKVQGAVGKLGRNTNEVLAAYAKTLKSLADGRNFDYSESLGKTKSSLAGLKDGAGAAAIDKGVVDAATAVADLLLKIGTESRRREAVQRLVDERPHLQKLAASIRSYFGSPAPDTSPYTLQMQEDDAGLNDVTQSLAALARVEPIRAREWQDDIGVRRENLAKRANGQAARQIVAAVDEWLASLDVFAVKAFRPDAKEWRDQLNVFRTKVTAARDAVAEID